MRKILKLTLVFVLFLSFYESGASTFISSNEFLIFRDADDLSFSELIDLEKKGVVVFQPFDGLNHDERVFWIKINAAVLSGFDYLYLSNYMEKIEAFYPGDSDRYSLTGRLVPFTERTYQKGFYRNALEIDPNGGVLYVKISSKHGYSYINQSLSHLELVSSQTLIEDQSRLYTTGVLLLGMEIVILIINVVLLCLRPSYTVAAYIAVILTGLLLTFTENETFIDQLGLSGEIRQMIEIYINVLLIYCFFAFTAFYLNIKEKAPRIYQIILFPTFLPVLALAHIGDGRFFPPAATVYFLTMFGLAVTFLIKNYKEDRERSRVFIFANLGVFVMASMILMALNNLLPHRFTTTHLAFIAFVIRDIFFTVHLVLHYFQLQRDTMLGEITITQLQNEKDQLKRIEQLKTTFFNNVSHELRTPLTLILSPLESSLESDNIPDEVRKELNLSLKNGKYLLQLVNEMLDLAKMDQGELSLATRPLEVVAHVGNIRDTFVSYAKSKQQTLSLTSIQDAIMAEIDRDKFEKIIINLLSNAIKYTKGKGNVTIHIATDHQDLVIAVADQGIGISDTESLKIFDRYYQTSEAGKEEGTGIGLSIVKEFMMLHHGSVSCKSEIGVGSIFTLRFNDCIIETEVNKQETNDQEIHDLDKLTILIVEDQKDMREYLKNKLSTYNIEIAPNGKKAIEKLRDGLMPNLILTDFMMPKMNGYEMVQTLRESEQWVDIPVIFLTARTLTDDKIKVLNLGVDDYIIKPFNLPELKVRIKNTLDVSLKKNEFIHSKIPELSLELKQSFKTELDAYLLAHLTNSNLSNSDLAHHFALSERNLFRRVKLVTGQPPASYIREIRLQKARLILESSTEKTISEVAIVCGIDNLTYFSQAFKKRFGKSPSQVKITMK